MSAVSHASVDGFLSERRRGRSGRFGNLLRIHCDRTGRQNLLPHERAARRQVRAVAALGDALPAPRRTRALAGLCADLTATQTTYPGTDLTLVYAVTDN